MTYWQGKSAVVTGASAGLGKAIAAALARAGAKVVIAARGAEKLHATADELKSLLKKGTGSEQGDELSEQTGHRDVPVPLFQHSGQHAGGDVLAVPADVTADADVARLVEQTLAAFGRIDLWVNNAGRSDRGAALATTPENFQALWELNFLSVVRCTRAAAPHLLATRGHLVNVGSLAAKVATRYMGGYAATKFAVAAYSQQLRLELEPRGLHVLLVCPGPIARDEPRAYGAAALAGVPASARQPGAGARVARISPDRLAEQILTACRRRKKELIVPGRARLLFALAQLSPGLGDWLVRRWT